MVLKRFFLTTFLIRHLFLLSINLLSEILTCLLHPGSATEVGFRLPQVGWDHLVEKEEEKEAGTRQEQQALVHGC